ncbi:BglG family transcription antiterminator [Enterococcus sp. AZ103]|uniref:BglG family transcription antiterminator n=1 Tax=Enterococcus sp. AZ103 TaxID=2774628 RepID=UPI003F237A50
MKERTLSILSVFIASDYPLELTSLEKDFKVSIRTIRNELKEINQFLKEKKISEIKSIRQKGYQLSLSKEERNQLGIYLKEASENEYLERENRIFDLILTFTLGQKNTFLYQKEEEYQISKSTLDEDMRRVRSELEEYGIEVMSVPKQGIVLRGAERSVRTMIYDVINRTVGVLNLTNIDKKASLNRLLLDKYISNHLLKKLDDLYIQTVSFVEDDIYRNQLIIFTAVWLSRYMRQDLIASTAWETADVPTGDMRNFVNAVCETFQINPPEIEIKYIVFMLNTFNSRDMNNSIEWVQAQLLSIQLIEYVENETKIPFTRKEEVLQEGLYKHIAGLINRVKSQIQIVNPLKENIKKNYFGIYQAIQNFMKKNQWWGEKKVSDDEVAFLTIHFSTSVSAINQDLHYIYKAVVVCNHGVATGKLLAENLKELFNIEVLAILSSRETELIDKLDVDLVFSSVALNYQNRPLLEVNPIIREKDKQRIIDFLQQHASLRRLVNNTADATEMFYSLINIIEASGGSITGEIYSQLENTFDKNNLTINKKEIQPMLEDVLKDSHILLNQQVDDWQMAIQRVSEPLLKEKVIEENYVTAMIDSVKQYGPYIVIGKHLALAHARPEDGVNKLGVSVATLKEPIVFGNPDNDPVKIIFCLAAIDSYSHLNIMKNLIALINDEEKLDYLCQLDSVDAFKDTLFQ